jgi:hypothetical protein
MTHAQLIYILPWVILYYQYLPWVVRYPSIIILSIMIPTTFRLDLYPLPGITLVVMIKPFFVQAKGGLIYTSYYNLYPSGRELEYDRNFLIGLGAGYVRFITENVGVRSNSGT